MNVRKKATVGLAVGALGVVFGDIGTSPLYALTALFGHDGFHVRLETANIYGVISLVIWAVTLVVSIKYITFLMRADNKGEGGIIALIAKLRPAQLSPKAKMLLIAIGLVGVALFYGDSTVTPAISVLS